MSARLYFWRHGQTSYNVERRFQGHVDIPLDDVGERQADEAAAALAPIEPDLIVTSDLQRAQSTAGALVAKTGAPLRLDTRLRERSYGLWEGLRAEEIEERYPDDFHRWRHGVDPLSSDVETRAAAADRAVSAVKEHLASKDEPTIVFVSHGGLITCAVTALLGQDPTVWLGLRGMDNCHWAELAANPGREPTWRLAAYNRFPA